MAQEEEDFKGFVTMLSRAKLRVTKAFIVNTCLLPFSAKSGVPRLTDGKNLQQKIQTH